MGREKEIRGERESGVSGRHVCKQRRVLRIEWRRQKQTEYEYIGRRLQMSMGQTGRQADRQAGRQTETETEDRETDRVQQEEDTSAASSRMTVGQADRQAGRQTGRQRLRLRTERQTECSRKKIPRPPPPG